MNQSRALEIERRLRRMMDRLDKVEALANKLNQSSPWAYNKPPGEDGGNAKLYWAISDGSAVSSGTWPSLTVGTFTSAIYDMDLNLVEGGATVLWFYQDALTTSGSLVPVLKVGEAYVGLLESCTAVTD